VAVTYSGWMPCFMLFLVLMVGWLPILYPEPPGWSGHSGGVG
jgi:hypothetical protein